MGYLKGFAVPKSSGYAAQGRQTVQLTVTDANPFGPGRGNAQQQRLMQVHHHLPIITQNSQA
jgi:hypothetical protein